MENSIDCLYNSCHICLSLTKFPREMQVYDSSQFPSHPGSQINADVIRRARQYILVNADMFSKYTTLCLIPSESASDLVTGLIQLITPIRHANEVCVRVDRAWGFVNLNNNSQSALKDLGMKIQLADHENKNSNCTIDKIINKLETEIKKLSPNGDQITAAELAEATVRLNNKIMNRWYTSSEIHFSRDFVNSENLDINNEELQEQQVEKLLYNHPYASQSKTPGAPIQSKADAETGDLVYIKNDLDKHTGRAPHLVLEKKDNKCLIKKRKRSENSDILSLHKIGEFQVLVQAKEQVSSLYLS